MKQSPSWKTIRFSVSQEIPAFYVTRRFNTAHTRVRPPLTMLSHINSVPDPARHFWRIHFNTILPSMSWSAKWRFHLRFPNQKPVCACHSPIRVTRPVQLIFLLIIRQYLVTSTGHYAVSSASEFSLPFYALIPSSAPHSQLHQSYVILSMWKTIFKPI
jgi:hypothetical protein